MKTKRNIITVLSVSVAVFLGVQCSPNVTTTKMSSKDLSNYKTYAYLPTSDTVNYRDLQEDMVEEVVMNEINSEMQEIGYSVNKDQPDLLIKTHVMFEQEESTVTDPVYTDYPYYYPGYSVGYASPYYYTGYNTIPRIAGYDVDEITYTEGTIAIDVIDAKTNEIIWRGWAENPISPDNFASEVKGYVDEVFEEYPVEDGEAGSSM